MFTINGMDWDIVYVSPFDSALYMWDGTLALGMCDKNEGLIYINETLDNQKLREALCHEIVHAAMFSYQVELTYEQEELLATLISMYGDEIISITNEIFTKLTNY